MVVVVVVVLLVVVVVILFPTEYKEYKRRRTEYMSNIITIMKP